MTALAFTSEQISLVLEMRSSGSSWDTIGKHFGMSGITMRCRVDPDFAKRKRDQARCQLIPDAASVPQIPPDTRTRMQKFFGDPPFERSALGQMEAR